MGSAWSHHGNRLAVQAAELSSTGAIVANVLMVRELDGLERVVGRCRSASTEAPCELLPVDWTPDDSAILVTSRMGDDPRSRLTLWSAKAQDPVDAPIDTVVSDDQWNVSQGAFSPDGKWLAFAYGGAFREEKGIAVVRATGATPKASWQPVAARFEDTGNPLWAHDGGELYFTSSRHSGRLKVWRVRIAPATGVQTGSPVAVDVPEDELHFILNRSYYPRMAVGLDKLVLPMNSQKISVWLLDNVDR
jgi:Tol biopolymer transport system component